MREKNDERLAKFQTPFAAPNRDMNFASLIHDHILQDSAPLAMIFACVLDIDSNLNQHA